MANVRDEIAHSALNSVQWITGGAAGGIAATWVIRDLPDIAIVVGVLSLAVVTMGMDFISRLVLGFPNRG